MVFKLSFVVALCVVVVGSVAAILWQRRQEHAAQQAAFAAPVDPDRDVAADPADDAPVNVPAEDDGRLDPALAALLLVSTKDDRDHQSPFFTGLADIARKQGLSLKDYAPDRYADEGYAFRRGDNVIVVLRGWGSCIPGRDAQTLLLFDRRGVLLDTLTCGINARLTHMFVNHVGVFRTEAPWPPEQDGTQLIIRYIPDGNEWHENWAHDIAYAGQRYTFAWNPSLTDWGKMGLCRIAIKGGRFAVLFPTLK